MPFHRSRYPKDWEKISERIRFQRAHFVCECEGECGHDHRGRCTAAHGMAHPITGSKVVLTVAHLDHTPSNCADDNLKAMCQRCHLSYDGRHHAQSRARRERHELEAAGQRRMFDDD
jgi:hypothetical protein